MNFDYDDLGDKLVRVFGLIAGGIFAAGLTIGFILGLIF